MAEAKEIKKILIDNDLTMKWLWRRVIKRGFETLHYSRFTEIMNGSYVGGYSSAVIEAAQDILKEQKS